MLGRSEVQTVTLGPLSPTASEEEPEPKSGIVKWLKRLPDPGLKATETPVDGEPQPSVGKFNKFWNMQADDVEGGNGTGIAETPELDENPEPMDGPIVDGSALIVGLAPDRAAARRPGGRYIAGGDGRDR